MDSIRLQNLRNLHDTGFVEIKPITFLLGSNSSGKSTFLRSLPLLRQSIATRTTGPILWFGELVDFGSFSEAVSRGSSDCISFGYKFTIPPGNQRTRTGVLLRILEPLSISIELKMFSSTKLKGRTFCKEILLKVNDHECCVYITADQKVEQLLVNGDASIFEENSLRVDFLLEGLVPQIFRAVGDDDDYPFSLSRTALCSKELRQYVRKFLHHSISSDSVRSLVGRFGIGSSTTMLNDIKTNPYGRTTWKSKTRNWTDEEADFVKIKNMIMANNLSTLLGLSNEYISNFSRRVSYIGPVRATAERYYRSQDLAVGEVDSKGNNLAMFLRNLTEGEIKDFSKWTEESFGFIVTVRTSGDHVSLKINEKGSPNEVNLADTGLVFRKFCLF